METGETNTAIARRSAVLAAVVVSVSSTFCLRLAHAGAAITLDSQTTYQTISGWEAMGWVCQWDDRYQVDNHHKWVDAAADIAVEVGINRVRIEVRSGSENPVDYFTQYINGQIQRSGWSSHWYDAVNDNSDPNVANSNGLHFSELDVNMSTAALPLK